MTTRELHARPSYTILTKLTIIGLAFNAASALFIFIGFLRFYRYAITSQILKPRTNDKLAAPAPMQAARR